MRFLTTDYSDSTDGDWLIRAILVIRGGIESSLCGLGVLLLNQPSDGLFEQEGAEGAEVGCPRFWGRKLFTTEGTEDTEKTAARILQAFADFATVA